MKRIDTMSIRDILRHHHDLGLPRAEIAVAVSVSAGTVSNVLERAQAAGLSWPLPSDLDDDGLRAQLYPPAPRESGYAQPDWDDVLRELRAKRKRRRVRATRRTLWEEYRDETRAQGGKAYSYSQFCARLKAHQGNCGGSAQMHFDYEPGLYGMADFSGKTLALRTGRGETDVEIFVAVLAHSILIYAEAVPDQTVRHWTMAHRRALEYFGGTPRRWIIDNLKSGVDDPDRDDIRLNPSYRELARHYKIAVLPARKYRATDKGLVESCVKAVQTRILLALRHQTFFSLDAMNAAIRRELDRLNDTPMAKCGESRRALFEANERAALAALPAHAWEWGVVKHALLTPRNPARSIGYRADRHQTCAPINTRSRASRRKTCDVTGYQGTFHKSGAKPPIGRSFFSPSTQAWRTPHPRHGPPTWSAGSCLSISTLRPHLP